MYVRFVRLVIESVIGFERPVNRTGSLQTTGRARLNPADRNMMTVQAAVRWVRRADQVPTGLSCLPGLSAVNVGFVIVQIVVTPS